MKFYKIVGWFLTLVSPIGFTSYILGQMDKEVINYWSMSIILLGVLFFVSTCVIEKVGQWMQFIILYLICFMALVADRAFGDIAIIMGIALLVGQLYGLVVKHIEVFYGSLIFVLYGIGYFLIEGSEFYRFSETCTRALLSIIFMVILSLGITKMRENYR